MNIISYNVCGLGDWEKRKEVLKLVRSHQPWVLCIQKTKLKSIDEFMSTSLWGSASFGLSFGPYVGASGRILILWDTSEVEVWDRRSLANSVIIHGRFVKSGCEFFIANVYAPCDSAGRHALWLHLGDSITNNSDDNWRGCGD